MNKERKATLALLTDVLQADFRDDAYTKRQARACETGLQGLISSEERAMKAMEPYKEQPGTASNYRNTVASLHHLEAALECLVEEDLAGALDHLEGAADPTSRQVHREPKKTTRRAKK
jgi:hypothetical protein